MNQSNALQLIEGSKDIRDQYANRVDVLDKVGQLIMLDLDDITTIENTARYYDVNIATIRKVIYRHKSELENDGLRVMDSKELREYKGRLEIKLGHRVLIKHKVSLTVVPRRAVLRIGMLLTESKIAEEIRTYLLDVESENNSKTNYNLIKYWTKEDDMSLHSLVIDTLNKGGTLHSAYEEFSKKTGRTVASCSLRWNRKLKNGIFSTRLNVNQTETKVNENKIDVNIEKTPVDNTYSEKLLQQLIDLNNNKISWLEDQLEQYKTKDIGMMEKLFQIQGELNAVREILEEKDKMIKILEQRVNESSDAYVRTLKERDNAETKAKRWQKKYRDLEANVKGVFMALQGQSNISQSNQLDDTYKGFKTVLKMDRNGNLEQVK